MRSFHVLGKKIIAVASNYRCHIAEMGGSLPSEPVFFLKPTSSYVLEPNPIRIPAGHEVHHEVELGVVIRSGGTNIPIEVANSQIAGYCLALDMTARDLQMQAKANGLPWTIAKGFDTFCPVSAYVSKNTIYDHQDVDLWLKVNGKLRQKGNTRDMVFKVMRLEPGDLILTGTPAGVGPLKVGDTIEAGLGHDYLQMRFRAVPKPKTLRK